MTITDNQYPTHCFFEYESILWNVRGRYRMDLSPAVVGSAILAVGSLLAAPLAEVRLPDDGTYDYLPLRLYMVSFAPFGAGKTTLHKWLMEKIDRFERERRGFLYFHEFESQPGFIKCLTLDRDYTTGWFVDTGYPMLIMPKTFQTRTRAAFFSMLNNLYSQNKLTLHWFLPSTMSKYILSERLPEATTFYGNCLWAESRRSDKPLGWTDDDIHDDPTMQKFLQVTQAMLDKWLVHDDWIPVTLDLTERARTIYNQTMQRAWQLYQNPTMANQALRISGVITMLRDIDAREIPAEIMAASAELAEWYHLEYRRIRQQAEVEGQTTKKRRKAS